MCLMYSTTSGSWKWSGSVVRVQNQVQNQFDSHSCLPFTQDCRGGTGRHTKQTNEKQQKLSLRKKRKVLNPFKCMLPRKPLLAILFIMLVWLSLERSDIGDLLLYRGWFEPVIFIYIYILFNSKCHFFFYFFRLWQGIRSSQGKEFKKEINATIDKSYVSWEEGCEFVVYKQSFSTWNKWEVSLILWLLLILCCCANPTQCMYNVRSNQKNVLFDSSLCLKHTVMLIPSCWSVTM